ncbi:S1C family serine protease [Bacillus alkalicellulosilyticus]|uniref:S1C family serine protease n=1 Tax=Alkalihalobacterium alkalicellulosilyticum TaxID=1912214 RepID=UPI000996C4B7|nr:serine protease [Bacillus alkalicellulosilyticus]
MSDEHNDKEWLDEEIDENYVPTPEDFLFDEEENETEKKEKKRSTFFKRFIAFGIVFILVMNGVVLLFQQFGTDAFAFVKTSYELSQNEDVQQYKESVVVIQGERSRGTGFSISPNGYIVTNHHVIDGMLSIGVTFENGDRYVAELIESYPEVDLAFLKIDAKDLPYLALREKAGAPDEHIYVIGNPLSFTWIVNEGRVLPENRNAMTISAPIYRGNSGSPVIASRDGEVIGVVFARSVPSIRSGRDSVGLAVPVEDVWERLPEEYFLDFN